jgi:membrane associated rhomboid family serine protease
MTFVDWIGSCGVFLILVAYYLNVTSRLGSKNLLFILLNLVGASLACLASYLIDYLPFVILEGVWALVSGYALFNYFSRHPSKL